MRRYCPNCQKEYDIKITSKEQAERPVCPECGQRMLQKETRNLPAESEDGTPGKRNRDTQPEEMIGNAMYGLIRFYWYLDGVCGLIGILAYCLDWNVVLYVDVAIGAAFAMIRFLIKILGEGGFLWIIPGMVVGLVVFRSLRGVCLGISIAFLLRFFYKVILVRLLSALIRAGSGR